MSVEKEYQRLADEVRAVHGAFHGGAQIDCRDPLCRTFQDVDALIVAALLDCPWPAAVGGAS